MLHQPDESSAEAKTCIEGKNLYLYELGLAQYVAGVIERDR